MHTVNETTAVVINEHSFSELLEKKAILFFGNGAEKTESVLGQNANANIISTFNPSAAYLAALAQEQYQSGKFEDVVYFEPFYLKQFVAGKPKVKGLE